MTTPLSGSATLHFIAVLKHIIKTELSRQDENLWILFTFRLSGADSALFRPLLLNVFRSAGLSFSEFSFPVYFPFSGWSCFSTHFTCVIFKKMYSRPFEGHFGSPQNAPFSWKKTAGMDSAVWNIVFLLFWGRLHQPQAALAHFAVAVEPFVRLISSWYAFSSLSKRFFSDQ